MIPWTRIARCALRPVLFSGNQEGSLGAWTLPVPRMGDRFALDVSTTQLRQDEEGRHFIAALMEATTAGARVSLFQPNRPMGPSAGAPVVHGANQAGTTLVLRGCDPGYPAVRGQFFGIVHGGIRYIHMITALTIVGNDGHLALPIWPMLRFLTTVGEPCELDLPMLEGQLVGFDKGAAFVGNRVDPFEFSVVERG